VGSCWQHRTPGECDGGSRHPQAIVPELEGGRHGVFHDAQIARKRQRSSVARKIFRVRVINDLQEKRKIFLKSVALTEDFMSRDSHPRTRSLRRGICFCLRLRQTAGPRLPGERLRQSEQLRCGARDDSVWNVQRWMEARAFKIKGYFAFIPASTSSAVCGKSFVICTRLPCWST